MKIVTAKEMARIERLSYEEGCSEKRFMQRAGKKVSETVQDVCQKYFMAKQVIILIGKGNNGGDGYVAAIDLLDKGYKVEALYVSPVEKSSSLNQFFHKEFVKKGGKTTLFSKQLKTFPYKSGIIVDALLGTGFKGELKEPYLTLVQMANTSKLPIVCIDVPSGLDATTGNAQTAIIASCTVYLGLAKIGFFLNDGWNVVGKLVHGDFGLSKKYIDQANEKARLFLPETVELPLINRKRHKYQSGYVLALAGSKTMSGAAKLSAFAALRSGAGIVRLFYPEDSVNQMINAPFELICSPIDYKEITLIQKEMKRAKAMFIGPGLGKDPKIRSFLHKLVKSLHIPVVFDADALYLCSDISWPKDSILTPHHQEMMHLLQITKKITEEELLSKCQAYVQSKQVIIILKGAPTWIFHPDKKPLVVPYGDPGMATAGAGDVLTGILTSMLSQGIKPYEGAGLAVFIHALAGETAAREKTSYSMIASDITASLPKVFQLLRTT